MSMNKERFSKTILCLWILIIASGFVVFSLSILLIRSKQHVMQYGYNIGQLEASCVSYNTKIGELDKKILELSNFSNISVGNSSWTKTVNIRHIKKRDVQYFAFNKKLRNNQVVASNLKK